MTLDEVLRFSTLKLFIERLIKVLSHNKFHKLHSDAAMAYSAVAALGDRPLAITKSEFALIAENMRKRA